MFINNGTQFNPNYPMENSKIVYQYLVILVIVGVKNNFGTLSKLK